MAGISSDSLRAQHSEVADEYKKQLAEKDRQLKAYRREHGKLSIFFDEVLMHLPTLEVAPRIYIPPTKNKVVGSPVTAVIQNSDWHMGGVQIPDEIEGFGVFNPEVLEDRVFSFGRSVIDWISMHRYAYTINKLHVLVTGDMISGDIHEELRITNAFPSPVQCVKAGELLAAEIAYMAPMFEEVVVEFLIEDNHSRLTHKPQASEASMNSLNYVVGYIAKQRLASHQNVQFNLLDGYEAVVHVAHLNYLITHGHNIRGWMGIPWYSIERRVGKESTKRLNEIMRQETEQLIQRAKEIGFNKMRFGHWHTPFDSELYGCSGSPSGTTAYDHKDGRQSYPSQPAWLIHPRKGEFDLTNFRLR